MNALIVLALACAAGAGEGDPMDQARDQAAKVLGVKASSLTVSTLDDHTVPGVTLLGVAGPPAGRKPRVFAPAAVADGQVVVGGDEVRRLVLAKWGWAPGKVDPLQVATVLTPTLELPEAPKLVADAERVTYLGRLGVQGVELPREDTIDGVPAVVWWVQTGQNPATEVILKVPPDGAATVSYGRTHGGG